MQLHFQLYLKLDWLQGPNMNLSTVPMSFKTGVFMHYCHCMQHFAALSHYRAWPEASKAT